MNREGDFRFSGADEFSPNFCFSSTSASSTSRSGCGRSRSRLAKLRKPNSSIIQRGAADLPCNNPDTTYDFLDGEACDKVCATDENSAAGLLNEFEFEKLDVKENAASYFEFRSSKNRDCHGVDTSSSVKGSSGSGVLPDMLRKLNFEVSATDVRKTRGTDILASANGCTDATLSKGPQLVCVQNVAKDSNSGLSDENLKNEADNGNKENVLFQEAVIIGNPSAFGTPMPPENGGMSTSSAPTSTSSATNICSQNAINFTHETFVNGHAREGFCFTGKCDASISPNIRSSFNRKVKSVPKKHAAKQGVKKKKENVNLNMESKVDPASCRNEFSPRPESPQPYSPMDMSPTPENKAIHSNNTPMTPGKTFNQGGTIEPSEITTQEWNHPPYEDLTYAAQHLNIGKNVDGTHTDDTQGYVNVGIKMTPPEECAPETEAETFKPVTEFSDLNSKNSTPPASSCNSKSDGSGSTNFYSVCNSSDTSGTKFIFTASPSPVKPVSVRRFKSNNKLKGFDSYRSTAPSVNLGAISSGQHSKGPLQDNINSTSNCSQLNPKMDSSASIRDIVNHNPSGAPESSTVMREACEKWRLKGNEAYANGDLSKAEECYTRGVRCIPKSEKSKGGHRSLMLCYSNRAATLMSLGRLREAAKDSRLAVGIDPCFLKAHVRAANCYLALGEIEEAVKHFKYCLQSGTGVTADGKIFKEASEGLQKALKAADGMSRSIESIQHGSRNEAENALRSADKALAICMYSEKLLEIKAEALFVLQKYRKVIKLCQKSLDSAERNSNSTGVNGRCENSKSDLLQGRLYFRLWRCRLMLTSYFFLGKLEEALALLEKHELLRKGSETWESLIPLVAVVKELLRYKAAGNEAFQSENYAVAVEHYTAALACNTDSLPFAAICLCNRAAAYKAQGKVIDSIADCNLAIALEKDYPKAIWRRASLHESIRDYGQAAKDMEIIVSLLKKQADISLKKSQEISTNLGIPMDLRQAQSQLSRLEELAKKGTPLNMYLILDVKSSASASDIKKAYRQAALKHHPDKAGQILAKSNGRRNETWKGIAEDIQREADRLFKLIGEAYTVLSDPAQRSGYDAEEEIRNMSQKNRESFTSRTHFD